MSHRLGWAAGPPAWGPEKSGPPTDPQIQSHTRARTPVRAAAERKRGQDGGGDAERTSEKNQTWKPATARTGVRARGGGWGGGGRNERVCAQCHATDAGTRSDRKARKRRAEPSGEARKRLTAGERGVLAASRTGDALSCGASPWRPIIGFEWNSPAVGVGGAALEPAASGVGAEAGGVSERHPPLAVSALASARLLCTTAIVSHAVVRCTHTSSVFQPPMGGLCVWLCVRVLASLWRTSFVRASSPN